MANDFRELLAWQMAAALEEKASVPIERAAKANDITFKKQLSDAASSAPRNIAEGFSEGIRLEAGVPSL
jgi:four helix bundle protein